MVEDMDVLLEARINHECLSDALGRLDRLIESASALPRHDAERLREVRDDVRLVVKALSQQVDALSEEAEDA